MLKFSKYNTDAIRGSKGFEKKFLKGKYQKSLQPILISLLRTSIATVSQIYFDHSFTVILPLPSIFIRPQELKTKGEQYVPLSTEDCGNWGLQGFILQIFKHYT